jgi:AcrR family transcriptional regulator
VQLIFDATALVLQEQGELALTTNRIAERAGVSIGTLYQYFDNKEAIVQTMLSQERARVRRQLDGLLERTGPAAEDALGTVRQYVRLYVSAFGTGARGRRALIRLAWRLDRHDALTSSMREASDRIAIQLQRLTAPPLRTPTPAMTFAMTRALAGIVRSAALEESPLLGTLAFEDELVNVCWGVLTGCASR